MKNMNYGAAQKSSTLPYATIPTAATSPSMNQQQRSSIIQANNANNNKSADVYRSAIYFNLSPPIQSGAQTPDPFHYEGEQPKKYSTLSSMKSYSLTKPSLLGIYDHRRRVCQSKKSSTLTKLNSLKSSSASVDEVVDQQSFNGYATDMEECIRVYDKKSKQSCYFYASDIIEKNARHSIQFQPENHEMLNNNIPYELLGVYDDKSKKFVPVKNAMEMSLLQRTNDGRFLVVNGEGTFTLSQAFHSGYVKVKKLLNSGNEEI